MKINRSFLKLVVLHFSFMAVVGSCMLFLFSQFLLPVFTRHGQFITVPYLKGTSLEEAESCLAQRNLRFEVTSEVAYVPDYPPMTVLQQNPQGGAYVKEGRKIYLTINTPTLPQVKMPDLIDGSIRNAQVRLKSQGLRIGTIHYVPDVAQNAVLEQWHQGKKITAETLIAKGSKIDLVVGAGLGSKVIEVPRVISMQLEDARTQLLSAGMQVGSITYQAGAQEAPGTVLRQYPNAGQQVSIGQHIDLWLVARQQEVEEVAPDSPLLPEHEE